MGKLKRMLFVDKETRSVFSNRRMTLWVACQCNGEENGLSYDKENQVLYCRYGHEFEVDLENGDFDVMEIDSEAEEESILDQDVEIINRES